MPTAKPTVTLEQFGRVILNDWPLRVRARLMLDGKAREFWYQANAGKAPWFGGAGVAEKALRRLYRQFGHLVTAAECEDSYAAQAREREESQIAWRIAWFATPSLAG
jgi:hypothetical protein